MVQAQGVGVEEKYETRSVVQSACGDDKDYARANG